jgi:AraC-like DNA-binding protein
MDNGHIKYIMETTLLGTNPFFQEMIYYEYQASSTCNTFEIYPHSFPLLAFNFSEGETNLQGSLLPAVTLIPISKKTKQIIFEKKLKILVLACQFGLQLLNQDPKKPLQPFYVLNGFNQAYKNLVPAINANDFTTMSITLERYFLSVISQLKYTDTSIKSLFPSSLAAMEMPKLMKKSVRQLERDMKKKVGMSPKAYNDIRKYEQIERTLLEKTDLSFTHLAYEFGFADQSHLIKTIRKFTNQTPRELHQKLQCMKTKSKMP